MSRYVAQQYEFKGGPDAGTVLIDEIRRLRKIEAAAKGWADMRTDYRADDSTVSSIERKLCEALEAGHGG